jgi:hypothetical protein
MPLHEEDRTMQQETRVDLNQRTEFPTAPDVAFAWKLGVQSEVPVNTFFPESLVDLNRKTPVFYEILNPMPAFVRREEIIYTATMHSVWTPEMDIINTEELPDASQTSPLLYKAQG